MARPSKLTDVQCAKAIEMRTKNPKRWSAIALAKHFGVSESSMYTVLNGTYTARHVEAKKSTPVTIVKSTTPPPGKSLFRHDNGADLDVDLSALGEPTPLEVAAAQLVLAKSRFLDAARKLQHA